MNKFLLLSFIFFIITNQLSSQEIDEKKSLTQKKENIEFTRIGVIDMQKILNESIAYQGVVEQFEDIRRVHRNKMTKQEDQIRDEESKLFKQKNIISKEAYAKKGQEILKKINNLKQQKNTDVKKFEIAFEKATNRIQKALVDVLSVIANERGLNLVLAKNQVLLVGKDIDLTDNAIKQLNKVLSSVKLELKK
ncbi:MAG: hypothetical protein CMN00_00400 [Rickettsiales bacterium]|nr:hypothetical protein [Rickettsiales bacterium]